MGLRSAAPQCHTHKYDPLTHQEYYRLFAFFNNANEIDEHVLTPEIRAERESIEKQIAALIASLPSHFPVAAKAADGAKSDLSDADYKAVLESAYASWQKTAVAEIDQWQHARAKSVKANLATMKVLSDDSVLASGDVTKNDIYDLEFDLGEQTITAIRIEALLDDSLPHSGPGRQTIEVPNASSEGDFFLSELTGSVVEGQKSPSGQLPISASILPLRRTRHRGCLPNRPSIIARIPVGASWGELVSRTQRCSI